MRSSKIRPFLILGAALLVIVLLFLGKRTPEDREQPDAAPLVRTLTVEPEPYRFYVMSQGSVSPRIESEIVPQVAGEIVEMSPSMVVGGYFEKGDILAKIDKADHRVEREAARAQVARARSEFARADKEASRQNRLADRSVASQSQIDDAENALRVAKASLREAEARLERANRDFARTEIRAPYRGRVRSEQVDVGQFVTRGNAIATIYGVDDVEIRLPIPDRELAYLDIPLDPQAYSDTPNTPTQEARVRLFAEYAGRDHEWEGRLVRTEAELDPESRMVHLVARVADPFGLKTPRSAPLAIGLFVAAEIEGASLDQAFLLPRDALRPDNRVYLVDSEGLIRFREVGVVRTERNQIVVASGLEAGDRVCISPLDAAIDGMRVRVLETNNEPLGASL